MNFNTTKKQYISDTNYKFMNKTFWHKVYVEILKINLNWFKTKNKIE